MIRHALAAALGLLLAAPAAAEEALSPDQRDAVDQRIRAFLLENPEVIVEALEALEERRRAAEAQVDADLVAAHDRRIHEDGYSMTLGNPEGDVTIVEFSDYRCGYCKRAHPQLQALLEEDGNIRLILKEFPILGPESVTAARAAMAAARIAPDLYAAYHAAMMEHRGRLAESTVFGLAGEVGIDPDALRSEMEAVADTLDAQLRETYGLARDLEIQGTPSFVIGGRILRGLASPDQMRALVAAAREEAG